MKNYTLISPCFFGMEKMLAREITNLGYEIIKTEDGRITYKTDEFGIAKSNMWLRCAERVHLKIAEFEAKSFDELFENIKRINWSRYIPYGAQFPISKASSIKSKLYSTPDVQAIVKKAIVESLKKSYLEDGLLKEDKEKYPIFVFIHKDKVTISIDTTGDALHKRGYREKANKAPIRETLAAGLIYLTPWKAGRVLVDPMCGSGTILIEAAMIGINMAPGLNREFISEKWRTLDKKIWWDVRKDAFNKIDNESKFKIYGYDIDEESIDIARENAEIAGVDEYIEFNVGDATQFKSEDEFGFIITNPPYGERLEDKDSVKQLYKELGYAFRKLKNWSYYLITSYEDFEYEFGQKADKKRKLYNGMLKTNFFQYPGPKPPRNNK
ncbi:TPA: class I SAM-dependent RNA methyltransferase [Clostridioides difficile]|uniref:THUMP domain-containing class I SAM-dependent RNA methyltransferase n=1 Tax=Clostridioides difficile TaxID=1496 RepID=UPI00097FED5C|nr:class I SAM-dependent RNA methyltransferase [Clostridioides difficile]SJQ42564.1 Ribosomal RNA large subunit methyltransferase L [Clostridioides difficile]HBF0727130.1 class I SAM-dependent RNA methyltransferase [Clostridioides difficile]HBF6038840.1 class I SAM-dependent RNA methyltransferase [Clostridioides difficile]HBF7387104.1 class I SAM-dependent RNA methyltransferase [Clostridioides difficile]HBG3348874.1 class I SAM-dependent RNA methyltransferase [Clostridioides difficile]